MSALADGIFPIDFIGKRKISLVIFLGFVLLGFLSYLIVGFTLGTDFSGGIRLEFTAPSNIENIREIINNDQIAITTLYDINGKTSFLITAPYNLAKEGSGEYLLNPIKQALGQDNVIILSSNFVGPSVGTDFSVQAIKLLLIVTILMLIYIAFRFDFMYGIGAVSALIHDMIVMITCTILLRIPIDLTILAAFLTILGYSINDTIVIFDRVRENIIKYRNMDLQIVMNKSIHQTLKRTILTSLTTLFVAISIFIWSGNVLKDFGLLLIIGIVSGTYSSIFVASPITYFSYRIRNKNIDKS